MTDDKTSILCELIGHSWCSSLGCDVCHACGAVRKGETYRDWETDRKSVV